MLKRLRKFFELIVGSRGCSHKKLLIEKWQIAGVPFVSVMCTNCYKLLDKGHLTGPLISPDNQEYPVAGRNTYIEEQS